MKRSASALRRAFVITVAVAVTAACATSDERNHAQSSAQPTCNVAGKFCDTFFGP
jgi:hypothetical protein